MSRSELHERLSQAKNNSEVIVLDLVNGARVTATVSDVRNGDVVIKRPVEFQLIPSPQGMQAIPLGYGGPAYVPKSEITIQFDHIILIFDCPKDLVSVYRQVTSGIVTAGAGTLDQLDKKVPDLSKIDLSGLKSSH